MRANNIEMQVRDLSRTLQTKYYQEIYKKTNIRFFEKEKALFILSDFCSTSYKYYIFGIGAA